MAKGKTEAKDEEFQGIDFGEGDSTGDVMVDLSNVSESGDFEAIPRGTYPAIIEDCVFEYSKSSNNPMWSLRLEVEDGEYKGRYLFHHLVFSERGLPRVRRALARLGFNELVEKPFNPEKVAEEGLLVGTRCRARVDVRPYEGVLRNNVKDLLPPEDSEGFLG